MKKRALILEILIWTIILTVIFCVIIFTYSKIFVEPNTYTIKFKDIDGITKGSPVRFMGINVGHVRSLTSNNKSIKVKILITKKNMKLPNGTIARVEFYGLGGSKSIELMPPDGTTTDGIVTTDNIRIVDIVSKAKSFVEIIEIIEKYVKGIDKAVLQNALEEVKDTSPDKIKSVEKEINNFEENISNKVQDLKEAQTMMSDKIKNANDVVLKINKFIKR